MMKALLEISSLETLSFFPLTPVAGCEVGVRKGTQWEDHSDDSNSTGTC